MKKQAMTAAFAVGMLVSSGAMAQSVGASASADAATGADADAQAEPAAEPEPEPEPASEPAPAPAETKEEKEEPAADGDSDHDSVVGHIGIGYLGRQSIQIGVTRGTTIVAPIIGARYWLNDFMGIDAGLGLNFSGGKTTSTATGVDNVSKAGNHAVLLHAGVPLNLFDRGSFSFQVVPELDLGFAGTGDQDASNDKLHDNGFLLSVGAHAGAEIQFGFMGIPQLSLQGNVGLYVQHSSASTTQEVAGNKVRVGDQTTTFGTGLGPDPWDIFTGSVAALYYF